MNSFFAGRSALITGAGSGLGRHLTVALVAAGARVAGIDQNEGSLGALARELPEQAFAWSVGDVTDRKSLGVAVGQLEQRLGPIDMLFASAGIGRETTALGFSAEDVQAVIDVNLIGVANSVEAVLEGMLSRGRGHIVAISSLASFRGLPRMAGYCASKAGVNALMDSLRVELQEHGIRFTTICPGWVRTPLTANLNIPMPHLLEPEDAAARILDAVRRGKAFVAFPGPPARRLRLLRMLPCGLSDWLVYRVIRSLRKKRDI